MELYLQSPYMRTLCLWGKRQLLKHFHSMETYKNLMGGF
jgi:hypothetical protein